MRQENIQEQQQPVNVLYVSRLYFLNKVLHHAPHVHLVLMASMVCHLACNVQRACSQIQQQLLPVTVALLANILDWDPVFANPAVLALMQQLAI